MRSTYRLVIYIYIQVKIEHTISINPTPLKSLDITRVNSLQPLLYIEVSHCYYVTFVKKERFLHEPIV